MVAALPEVGKVEPKILGPSRSRII
jgi:hypothetical protein